MGRKNMPDLNKQSSHASHLSDHPDIDEGLSNHGPKMLITKNNFHCCILSLIVLNSDPSIILNQLNLEGLATTDDTAVKQHWNVLPA